MSDRPTEPMDDETRDVRIGRIVDEFLCRRSRGEAVHEEELLAAYPDLVDELRDALALVRDLRPATDGVAELIRQGILERSDDSKYLARFGAYGIVGFIGRGGMGIVLKAHEKSLNRTVALKILRPELVTDTAVLTRFQREAKAAAGLRHPSIVTVHAVGTQNGVPFLAMEYVPGRSLAELIRENVAAGPRTGRTDRQDAGPTDDAGPTNVAAGLCTGRGGAVGVPARGLPPETIRHIFRQLLAALGAAHAAGLIHRDVKSSNILLEQRSRDHEIKRSRPASAADSRELDLSISRSLDLSVDLSVKLADFGLARMRGSQTQLTLADSILGTPEYMSPEQARGDADLDHRTDLYSAGVVLYEMLTGRTPFQADTPTATLHRILHEDARDPRKFDKNVDPALASLTLRLMAKRREDRSASAGDAIAVLDSRLPVRSPARVRRRLRALGAGMIVVICLIVASRIAGRNAAIAEVRVAPDDPRLIQVRRANGAAWVLFHEFPESIRRAPHVVRAKPAGSLRSIVVAGLVKPLEGANLIAFDHRGKETWRCSLADQALWPDCGPAGDWSCAQVIAADVDGTPGDELIVRASEQDSYPTRISVVGAAAGALRSTFWHLGQLHQVNVERDFFAVGKPAIIAWGLNNKLDGFGLPNPRPPDTYECVPGEDAPRTRYDVVSVAMILDPRDMAGQGPPRGRGRSSATLARPWAYAFLDAPVSASGTYVPPGDTRRTRVSGADLATINRVAPLPNASRESLGPWAKINIGRPDGGGALLTVDRNFNIIEWEPTSGELVAENDEYWLSRWRAIVQNREYIRQ